MNVLPLAVSLITSLCMVAEKVPRAPESCQLCRLGESSSERLVGGARLVVDVIQCNAIEALVR